jgi:hypothetical protein
VTLPLESQREPRNLLVVSSMTLTTMVSARYENLIGPRPSPSAPGDQHDESRELKVYHAV